MFNRVRAYIIILVLMNLALSMVCLFTADSFTAPAYMYVEDIASFHTWGLVYLSVVLGALFGYYKGGLNWVRGAMSLSAAIMATWGVSFIWAMIDGTALGPTGGIVWLTIAALEIVIVSTPNIRPIEEYVSRKPS